MTRFARTVALALAVASPLATAGPAQAAEDVVYRFTPNFESTDASHWAERGTTGGSAWAFADADRDGEIDLQASVSGVTAPYPIQAPRASAHGLLFSTPFTWHGANGGGLRIEARFDVSFASTRQHAVEFESYSWDSSLIGVDFTGSDAAIYGDWSEWYPDSWSGSFVSVDGGRQAGFEGSGTASVSLRVPCEQSTYAPVVYASAGARLPSGSRTVAVASDDTSLNAQIREIVVYRDSSIPCYDIERIRVLNGSFDPAALTVSSDDMLVFDFTASDPWDHDIFLDGVGSIYDAYPIELDDMYGDYEYYCDTHPDMRGVLTVV